MAKARRVFELARELGIESKAVLDKCQAEGLDLHNHMSTVSIGLEATIREWFSEDHGGSSATAVETAEKVDLTKVKKARPRKRAKTADAADDADDADTTTQVAVEAPAEAAPSVDAVEIDAEALAAEKARQAGAKAKPRVKSEPTVEAPDEPAAPQAPAAPKPEAEKSKIAATAAAPAEAPEAPPERVGPAGPRLEAPEAAKLRGPKVVRIEEPEPVRAPRPRRTGPGGPGGGPGGPGGAQSPDFIPQTGPQRGRGAGRPGATPAEDEAGRSPRRKRTKGKKSSSDSELWTKGIRREQDLLEREARVSHAAGYLKQRRRQLKARAEGGGPALTAIETGGQVEIAEPFTIKDLSAATGIKGADVVKFLFQKGVIATINQTIGTELAMEVCLEQGIELVVKEAKTAEEEMKTTIDQRERTDVRRRPPVVAVLGHVDHGKTSLLDKIRTEDVAGGEAGGITQHIGAFRTTIKGSDGEDKTVVFLDTPGHSAFTNMRARGANLADMVVLVVAADDGVMPQTVESINHAKAAGIPIVVALNKIDTPQATDKNITKILGQLAEHELNPVDWGGSTEVMRVSAITGQGVTELIEVLDYQAELLELTADYAGKAYGQVIEAELDTGRGSVARVLVREGELHVGDFIVIGRAFGKVRSMVDEHGAQLRVAGPATPIEISGIDNVPDAGDRMYATDTLMQAEQIATQKRDRERKKELAAKSKVTLDNVFEHIQAQAVKELRIVLKADVQGSIEVLRKSLEDQGADEVKVRVLHAAVGGITESDVLLAEASDAVVVGFNVIAAQQARGEAERRGVDIRLYRVIYDIVDDVRKALEGMLSPTKREEVLGHAEVREVFRVSKVGNIAGCYVTDGVIRRNALIRVTRDGIVVEHDRKLEQLKRFKDDAKEVRNGMECGAKIDGYDDIHEGDVLECYVTTEVKATLA